MSLTKLNADQPSTGETHPEVECGPCLELLRRIDADLEEMDRERTARRRKIALGGVAALAIVTALCLWAYF